MTAPHRHHLTGRSAPDAPYLDPALVVVLDAAAHAVEHVCLRRAGIDFPWAGLDLLDHRLLRVADHALRARDNGRGLTLGPEATGALGLLLLEGVDALRVMRTVAS